MPSPTKDLLGGDSYFHVNMGPVPGKPPWHEQSSPSSYAFPTLAAAERFADDHHELEPQREIWITPPAEAA